MVVILILEEAQHGSMSKSMGYCVESMVEIPCFGHKMNIFSWLICPAIVVSSGKIHPASEYTTAVLVLSIPLDTGPHGNDDDDVMTLVHLD